MMKKLVSLALVLALCLTLVPAALAAEGAPVPSKPSSGTATELVTDEAYTVKQLTEFKYDAISGFSAGLAPVEVDGKWGLVDMTGREVLAPQFDGVDHSSYYNHYTPVAKEAADGEYKWGFVDLTGKPVIDYLYDKVGSFEYGCPIPVLNDGKWSFIDHEGKPVFDGAAYDYTTHGTPSFDWISEELSICFLMKDGKWGAIKQTGETVIPFDYSYLQGEAPRMDYDADLFFLQKDGKWGAVDLQNQVVIPFEYDYDGYDAPGFWGFSNGSGSYCWLQKDGKWGCFKAGVKEPVVPFIYDSVQNNFSEEGLAEVCVIDPETEEEKWGYVNTSGVEVIKLQYASVNPFSEGRGTVWKADPETGHQTVLLVDATGKEITPAKEYFSINIFSEGLAAARYLDQEAGEDKIDYIKPDGTTAFAADYDQCENFAEGRARVGKYVESEDRTLYGYISNTGEEVIPCEYKAASYQFVDGHAAVVDLNSKMGVIGVDGKFTLPCVLDGNSSAPTLYGYFEIVSMGGQKGLIDNQGRVVLPCQYQAVDQPDEGTLAVMNSQQKWALFSISGGAVPEWWKNSLTLSKNEISVNKGKTATVTAETEGYGGMGVYAISADAEVASVSVNYQTITVKGEAEGSTSVYVIMSDTDVTLDEAKANSTMQEIKVTVTKASSGGGSNPGSNPGGPGRPSNPGGSPSGPSTPATPSTPVEDEPKPASEVFADVEKDSWYEKGVSYVVESKLFQGTGEGVFAPKMTMTRGMLMTVLARKAGVDTTTGAVWYEAGMNWSKENKISDGLRPEDNITRMEIVTMLWRNAGSPESDAGLENFVDADQIPDWALAALKWAVETGVLQGKDGNRLDPKGEATRAEVAVLLERLWNVKA